ncbi:hypothetical protein ACFL1R_06350 [Candidatus Latescibacterota bacterium]
MFSKQDYLDYFQELDEIEYKMLNSIKELKALIKDDDIQKLLNIIHNDEKKHISLEKEIIEMFENMK